MNVNECVCVDRKPKNDVMFNGRDMRWWNVDEVKPPKWRMIEWNRGSSAFYLWFLLNVLIAVRVWPPSIKFYYLIEPNVRQVLWYTSVIVNNATFNDSRCYILHVLSSSHRAFNTQVFLGIFVSYDLIKVVWNVKVCSYICVCVCLYTHMC